MKNVFLKAALLSSSLIMIISFQNCSKIHPEILVDDKLSSAEAINSDEIVSPAEIPVEIGVVPDDVDSNNNDDDDQPTAVTDNDDGDKGGGCGDKKKDDDKKDIVKNEDDDDNQKEDDDKKDAEIASDEKNCASKKGGHHVQLDAQNNVYDGAKDRNGGGTTYISVKDASVVQEIKNTNGKTVLCGCQARKISANVGSLVMINSYADSLDGKRGNLVLKNSSITSITNMKGVIKK